MGVEYDLNDPQKGESFDLGKGWHGSDAEGSTDYDRAPSTGPGPCRYHAHRGPPYRWTPLASRDETLHYVTTHFYFLEAEPHSEECRRVHETMGRVYRDDEQPWTCVKNCEFSDGDPEYANELADRLWAWLQGRDQAQLDITDDASSDDIHCRQNEKDPRDNRDHEKWCVPHLAKYPRDRHFYVTGSRYSSDWILDKKKT